MKKVPGATASQSTAGAGFARGPASGGAGGGARPIDEPADLLPDADDLDAPSGLEKDFTVEVTGSFLEVSTLLTAVTVERLDLFCNRVHRTRAEVISGLLDALLVESKQFIYEDWRKEVAPKKKSHHRKTTVEVCALLQAELLNQPRLASDVKDTLMKAGVKARTLERAKAVLIFNEVMSKPENIGGSWYWKLAEGVTH
jgi:hypothetical protein